MWPSNIIRRQCINFSQWTIFFRPHIDRSLKPDDQPTSLMEGYLRQIVVPEDTMSKFLSLAHKNTAKNVETCGILAGRLSHNRLIITHVIVPKQSGTSDSCTTMSEEEIFDIQDQQNLITLGWIHVRSINLNLKFSMINKYSNFTCRHIRVRRRFYHRSICTRIALIKLWCQKPLLSFVHQNIIRKSAHTCQHSVW